jgi:hypothetical protein
MKRKSNRLSSAHCSNRGAIHESPEDEMAQAKGRRVEDPERLIETAEHSSG